ncbi:unnamed protein product, partial [Sphacelaria rigidula]
ALLAASTISTGNIYQSGRERGAFCSPPRHHESSTIGSPSSTWGGNENRDDCVSFAADSTPTTGPLFRSARRSTAPAIGDVDLEVNSARGRPHGWSRKRSR